MNQNIEMTTAAFIEEIIELGNATEHTLGRSGPQYELFNKLGH